MNNLVYDVKFINNIRELFDGSAEEFADNIAFTYAKNDGVVEITYAKAYEDVRNFANYLASKNLSGKKIAVIGKNCYEWAASYLAVVCGIGVVVPIDKELKIADINNILCESEAQAIIYMPEMSKLVDSIDLDILKINTTDFMSFCDEGKDMPDSYAQHKINSKELGVLIYTSGTTGMAKGVMLSQYNIVSDIIAVRKFVYVGEQDRVLSVLPLHHTYECTLGFLAILYSGGSIAYTQGLRKLVSDFSLFRPTIFMAVPLLIETIYTNIVKKVSSKLSRKIVFSIGKSTGLLLNKIPLKQTETAKKKLFGEIQQIFGGRLRMILVGAAALSPDIHKAFEAFGFNVLCGYGLTETAPLIVMQTDKFKKPGTVGFPISCIKTKILAPNSEGVGELCVKGSNVMLGYYKNPEETEKVLKDGWFNTGDLVKKGEDGAYSIVGRTKNMIVTKNGKKIFPEELEYYLAKSDYVCECMVYGDENDDGEVNVTAIIYPDMELLNDAIFKQSGIKPTDIEYREQINKFFADIIKDVNKNVPRYKMIFKYKIRLKEFEKTTTKKIKRNAMDNKSI